MCALLRASKVRSQGVPLAEEGAKARRNVRAVILKRCRELGGRALVIGNKATIEAMAFPSYVSTAHFNAVAGRDRWKDVRLVVVLGRPMPSPQAVERMAAALTGVAPNSVDGWYNRRRGRAPCGQRD